MDYKKKSLKNLKRHESYEEIDTRLASGWYVDTFGAAKKKKYKTKEVQFKIVKKSDWKITNISNFKFSTSFLSYVFQLKKIFKLIIYKIMYRSTNWHSFEENVSVATWN